MLFTVLLNFAFQAGAALAATEFKAAPNCETLFTEAVAADLARFRLTPEVLGVAAGADRTLLEALAALSAKLDPALTKRIAQSLIENPAPTPPEDLANNPFYREHPERIRPFASVTHRILADEFSDRFDAFELGLLSALIPDQRRVDETPDLEKMSDKEYAKIYGQSEKMLEHVLGLEDARSALVDLLEPLARDPSFLRQCENQVKAMNREGSYGLLKPESVEATMARLSRGKTNKRDRLIVTTLIMVLSARLVTHAQSVDPPDRIRAVLKFGGLSITIYYRDYVLKNTERYFTDVLGIRSNLATMVATYQTVANADPPPTPPKLLKQKILASAESLVFPIVQRLKTTHFPPRAKSAAPVTASLAKFEYKPKDMFAPDATSKKRRTTHTAPTVADPETPPSPWRRPSIAPERDLHEFTSFVSRPRALELLEPMVTYEFWYMRDDHPVRRFVRFGPEVVSWMRDHPAQARPLLNALHMGDYRGQMTGIKPIPYWPSKRFDGTVYEVKAHGKYRALLVFHQGRWDVSKVAHKDAVARAAQWTEPLDEVKGASADSSP